MASRRRAADTRRIPGTVVTGSEKMAADFVALVKRVLATVLETMEPPPVIRPEDVHVVAAELVKRVMAVYPRQRGLFGFRAIVDEYGMDSWYGMSALRAVRAYQTAIVASRLARLRSDGHAPQAEALLRAYLSVAARSDVAAA